ncbi:cytochrome c1 [Pelagibius sp. Alg239-R121]|uniref:cytochrome c1 n=1 Tax=Pelagibius sp. Alg239-R121 TaxID=2993448 RepID=UPI0024A620EB|nr:cytochrome c1 [Pelagibius sp. Alg239-R121]
MMKKLVFAAAAAAVAMSLGAAQAAEGIQAPKSTWSFSGIFGTFDQAQLQRGYQVYKEVCAGCHAMDLIAFRNLAELGYNEDEVKAIAAEYDVTDGPDDEGEMFDRPARPSDYFPNPFPNAKAAAASNGGSVPPDLSLMAKARAAGPDYLKAMLMGYEEDVPESVLQQIFEIETEKNRKRAEEIGLTDYNRVESVEDLGLPDTSSFNAYFPGYGIAMAAPLGDEAVEYADGTPATLENHAADVAAFLMWTAEPALDDRKQMGIKVIIFLLIFSGVLYAAKRKCWADLH